MPIQNPVLDEIELAPVLVELDDGGIDVDLSPDEDEIDISDHDANLAEYLSESQLGMVGARVCDDVKSDLDSRAEWENLIVKGMDELGLKIEETAEPFEGACSAHPAFAKAHPDAVNAAA